MITALVAHGLNREIGCQNQLLCHLPGDLKRFKALTMGHIVVMGRKTWDSLPQKPLPRRTNLVVSNLHRESALAEGAHIACGLDEAMAYTLEKSSTGSEIFIIGGGQIYRHFLPLCGKLLVSRIDQAFPTADTFFPDYAAQFERIESIPCEGYSFETWLR